MKMDGKRLAYALAGILLIGTGVAFNNKVRLGNDPIGMVYDGVKSFAGWDGASLGMASNLVNAGLIAVLLFIGRKYLNIGTLIYILPYGAFVSLGTIIYDTFFASDLLWIRCLTGAAGCLLLYMGVSLFIAADIGLDPFTGIVMVIRDKCGISFRITKILFDLAMILLGALLGGRLGVTTAITALTAGPVIQFFSERLSKILSPQKEA